MYNNILNTYIDELYESNFLIFKEEGEDEAKDNNDEKKKDEKNKNTSPKKIKAETLQAIENFEKSDPNQILFKKGVPPFFTMKQIKALSGKKVSILNKIGIGIISVSFLLLTSIPVSNKIYKKKIEKAGLDYSNDILKLSHMYITENISNNNILEEDGILSKITSGIKTLINTKKIRNAISQLLLKLRNGITNILYSISTFGLVIFSFLLYTIGTLFLSKEIFELLKNDIKKLFDSSFTKSYFGSITSKWDFVKGYLKFMKEYVIGFFKCIPKSLSVSFRGIMDKLSMAVNFIKGFFTGNKNKVSKEYYNKQIKIQNKNIIIEDEILLNEMFNPITLITNFFKKIIGIFGKSFIIIATGITVILGGMKLANMQLPFGLNNVLGSIANKATKETSQLTNTIKNIEKEVSNDVQQK